MRYTMLPVSIALFILPGCVNTGTKYNSTAIYYLVISIIALFITSLNKQKILSFWSCVFLIIAAFVNFGNLENSGPMGPVAVEFVSTFMSIFPSAIILISLSLHSLLKKNSNH